MTLECYFCGKIATVEAAVDAGWIPNWYDGDHEHLDEVCDGCQAKHLEVGADGETQLRREPKKEKEYHVTFVDANGYRRLL